MKLIHFVIIFSIAILGFSLFYDSGKNSSVTENNVQIIGDQQIISIKAKGGYFPQYTEAKAGTDSILRIVTSSTFDCSAILRIPSMDLTRNLPFSGNTDIDLGVPTVGTLEGTCGMGMYNFSINFL